jgi:S-adenosylmethionine hydrolase
MMNDAEADGAEVEPVERTLKITGLSPLNVRAIQETMPEVETTATTATFHGRDIYAHVTGVIRSLPGRGHPRASLHAVARKILRENEVQRAG